MLDDTSICSDCGSVVRPSSDMGASLQIRGSAGATDERRVVTVIFADLVGNTSLAERLDAEDMRRVLTEVFDALAREVIALDGTIDKYIGDEVMAVFGAPTAHEDDASRAVTASWRMQLTMQRMNPELERRYGARLALRIGINSGEVVAGVLAPNVQTAYTVVGDAVNVAKRFAQAAEPGEILIGATTRQLTRGFSFSAHPPVTAKGKALPVQVFSVRGISPAPRSQLSLIGRRSEAAAVRAAIDRLTEGVGSALAITGEAGIGKSRLLEYAREVAIARGVAWLEAHALQHAQHTSYWPFRHLLRAYASIAEEDADATKWLKLGSRLADLVGMQATELQPYLALLGGITAPAGETRQIDVLDAEARRRQVLRSAQVFFEALARRKPTVLAFEDLHWADSSSRQLLEHLLPLTQQLLICWTERPASGDAAGTFAEPRMANPYSEIGLQPLDERSSAELVTSLAGGRGLDAARQANIVSRAAGNPFFAQELVRSSLDLRGTNLPQSIQASITARLDALSPATRGVARLCSVVGRTFSSQLVRELSAPSIDVPAALLDLVNHNLVRGRQGSIGRDYAFTHALVQESIYAGIVANERRRLHSAVASRIETTAESLEEVAGKLAYHYTQAENWEKAQGFLFKLGDQALRIAADVEALDHYEQALNAYARAFGEDANRLARATVQRKLGEARSRLGDFALATNHLDVTLATLAAPRPSSRAGIRAGIAREFIVQMAHRAGLVRRERDKEAMREVLHALWLLQGVDFAADLERLLYDVLRTLNLSERQPPSHGLLRAYFGMIVMTHNVGLRGWAATYSTMASRVASQLGDALANAIAAASTAMDLYARGRYAEASTAFEAARAGYRAAGDLAPWAACTAYLNLVLVAQGRLADALPLGSELETVGRAARDRRIEAYGAHCIGGVLVWSDDPKLGYAAFERAIAAYRAIPDHHLVLSAVGDLARARLRAGDVDASARLIDEGKALARDHNLRGWWLTPLLAAEAGLLLYVPPDVSSKSRASVANRVCQRLKSQARLHDEARTVAQRVVGELEWHRGRHQSALRAWDLSIAAARAMGALTEELETHRTIARLTGTQSSAAAAESIRARLSATLQSA